MFGKCFVPFHARTTTDKTIFCPVQSCPVLSAIGIRYGVTGALHMFTESIRLKIVLDGWNREKHPHDCIVCRPIKKPYRKSLDNLNYRRNHIDLQYNNMVNILFKFIVYYLP